MVVETQNLDAEEMRKLMMVLLLLLKSNANFFQDSAIFVKAEDTYPHEDNHQSNDTHGLLHHKHSWTSVSSVYSYMIVNTSRQQGSISIKIENSQPEKTKKKGSS
jgi:hypothetical protein